MTTQTDMPVTSPGSDSAAAGDSLTLSGLPPISIGAVSYWLDRAQIAHMRLADADMRGHLELATAMMRYLELEARS